MTDYRLRFKVMGGGCAGFQYDIAFDEKIVEEEGKKKPVPALANDPVKDTDVRMVFDGLVVVVDTMSLMYLRDTEVDYVHSLTGAGFKFNNPNISHQCGCGKSFS